MISIALTTYNGELFIKDQIESIISQTYTDFELIVCDDCSKDSTLQILNVFSINDERIKIFENERNLGFLKNFEKAISLCSGDFIALCDQDDIWFPRHLEVLRNNIDNYSLVGANSILVDGNNNELGVTLLQSFPVDNIPQTQFDYEFHLLHENFFQGAAILFKKELIKKALPFPEGIKFHDWWLALVACSENGVVYVNSPILRYRQHGNNVTNNEQYNFFKKVKKMFLKKSSHKKFTSHKANVLSLLCAYEKIAKDPCIVNKAKVLVGKNKFEAILYFIKNRKLILLTDNKEVFWGKLGKTLFF